jgi:hypothetical protein
MKETKDIFNESYKPLKRFCLEERGRWGGTWRGTGIGERNGLNNVCTYE